MQAAADSTFGTVSLAEHGRVLVGRTTSAGGFLGKIGRASPAFMHEARSLWRASSRSYECIQVKDKFVTAALGLLVARIKGLRFYYWLSFPLPEAHQHWAREAGLMRRPMLQRDFGIAAALLIVGDGDGIADREAIEARGRQLKQQVTITGLLPRAEALERISTIDIAVSPFYPTPVLLSTSPTKIIEYMALGLPVVANEHPEQSEIIRSSGAGVCVPWSAEEFAGGVAALAKLSDNERAVMGERGRLWVERYRSYERIADELDKGYRPFGGPCEQRALSFCTDASPMCKKVPIRSL
ncbi:MAG TPA: glycosyltransferase [Rhodothermales bacterium]|nr:glycosyltransferase [Rhodothermales bacterium]